MLPPPCFQGGSVLRQAVQLSLRCGALNRREHCALFPPDVIMEAVAQLHRASGKLSDRGCDHLMLPHQLRPHLRCEQRAKQPFFLVEVISELPLPGFPQLLHGIFAAKLEVAGEYESGVVVSGEGLEGGVTLHGVLGPSAGEIFTTDFLNSGILLSGSSARWVRLFAARWPGQW